MRTVNYTNQFRKDIKLVSKRAYNMSRLITVMRALENCEIIDVKYKEHRLSGNFNGYLECHIEPDWLLIYKIVGKDLYFARTGTHSDLF